MQYKVCVIGSNGVGKSKFISLLRYSYHKSIYAVNNSISIVLPDKYVDFLICEKTPGEKIDEDTCGIIAMFDEKIESLSAVRERVSEHKKLNPAIKVVYVRNKIDIDNGCIKSESDVIKISCVSTYQVFLPVIKIAEMIIR